MKCKKWKGRKRNAQRSQAKRPLPLRLEAIGDPKAPNQIPPKIPKSNPKPN
ncbi:MAG: hypothetical protein ACK5UE_07155 [Chitinophagales bacterium]